MRTLDTVTEYYTSPVIDAFPAYRGIPMICAEGLHETVAEAVADVFAPGQLVLDVGTGRGAFALRMVDRGLNVHACDMNDLCMCREHVKFMHCRAESLDSERLYDGVFMLELLEHIEAPLGLIRKYTRYLNPGGHLIITTPNVDSDFSRAWFLLTGRHWYFEQRNVERDGHINPLHEFQFQYVFAELGLVPVLRFDTIAEPHVRLGLFRGLNSAMKAYRTFKRVPRVKGMVSVYVVKKPR